MRVQMYTYICVRGFERKKGEQDESKRGVMQSKVTLSHHKKNDVSLETVWKMDPDFGVL